MTLWEYQCRECANVFEAFAKYEDRDIKRSCPLCSGESYYRVSSPFLTAHIDSDKWVKNRESHMKQERKNMKNHDTYK